MSHNQLQQSWGEEEDSQPTLRQESHSCHSFHPSLGAGSPDLAFAEAEGLFEGCPKCGVKCTSLCCFFLVGALDLGGSEQSLRDRGTVLSDKAQRS